MKILLATYWPIPHLGGVWNYMVQLRKKLELLGHEVDMLGYDKDNISVYIVNENRKIERTMMEPLLEEKLNKEIKPDIYLNELVKYTAFQMKNYELSAAYLGIDSYDIIHTQDVLSTVCIHNIKSKDTPLVATLHGCVAYEIRSQLSTIHKSDTSYLAKAYYDEIEHEGATVADVTIVANQWLKNILTSEFRVPETQIKALHYGFDTEDFIKRSKEKNRIVAPRDKKVILYSGRLVELKGVHHLISALGELKRIRNDWVCWIVGNGDQHEELIKQSKELGLDENILFFGNRSDVPSLLTHADILVHPSLIENQPLSVIEAQIAGKAIIVSDVGGLPEMIEHGVTGLITPVGEINKLCNNLNLLLTDEQYRKILGSNAKKWGMTHWSLDRGVKNLLAIYEDVIH